MKQQHTLQPKLRFPEFEGDWENTKLGNIGEVKMCKRIFSEQTLPMGEVPFYKIGSFGKIADAFISRDLFEEYKRKFSYPQKGDILISASGTIGRTVIYNGEDAYFQDSNIIWLNINKDKIINEFLYFIYQITKYNTEGGTIQRLYNNILLATLINIPSLPEQQKIADYLSTIDNKINLLEEKKAQLALYKKAMMQKLFAQEIRFKPSEAEALEAYPGWEEKRLGEVAKKMQSGGTPKASNRGYYIDGTIPFLSISDITEQGKYLTYAKKTINKQGIENSSSWIVPINSLIYSMYASVGFVTINKIEIATSQAVMNIILKEIDSLEYIYYYLSYFKKFINRFIETGTQGNINAEIVKNIKLPYPSLPEQQKIAEFLSAIDESIEKVNEQITQTQSFKKAMLQQMFV